MKLGDITNGAGKLADVGKLGDAGKLKQLGELGLSNLPPGLVEKSKTTALPEPLKQKFETAFGTDLSDIKIVEGHAATLAGAKSFVNNNEIHFTPGSYNPFSETGEKDLGHEVAHVVQQRGGRTAHQAAPAIQMALEDES
jgi:uncharacterized protein DUF4157